MAVVDSINNVIKMVRLEKILFYSHLRHTKNQYLMFSRCLEYTYRVSHDELLLETLKISVQSEVCKFASLKIFSYMFASDVTESHSLF